MTKDSYSLRVGSGLNYACLRCGRCCRRWYAPISREEAERLKSLDWSGEKELNLPEAFTVNIKGRTYLAHRENGDCVFLDPETYACRIHACFGSQEKPLGCRLYPLNLQRTFEGEVSVNLRFDCPAVQQQHGPALTAQNQPEVQTAVQLLQFPPAFDETDTAGLSCEAIELIVDGARQLLHRNDLGAGEKSLILMNYKRRLEGLGAAFLNDIGTMREVMPSFLDRTISQVHSKRFKRLKLISRMAFRQWLVLMFRRDEDIPQSGLLTRLGRGAASVKLTTGFGSLHAVGHVHPDYPLSHAPIFPSRGETRYADVEILARQGETAASADAGDPFSLYWRFFEARLETLQFFGPAVYGKSFFDGLRGLIQTYAVVLAAARYHAAARGNTELEESDVAYGVGVVDHNFDKCTPWQARLQNSFEAYFDNWRYGLLLRRLGWA